MDLWGETAQPGKDVQFSCEDGCLDLTQITLASGKSALVKFRLNDSDPAFCICSLTEDRPNYATRLYFEEDAQFVVEGSKDVTVSLVGNLRLHHDDDFDEDDDECGCGSDMCGMNEEDFEHLLDDDESSSEDAVPDGSGRVVEVTEEEAKKIKEEEQTKRKGKQQQQTIALPSSVENKAAFGAQIAKSGAKRAQPEPASVATETANKKQKTGDAKPTAKPDAKGKANDSAKANNTVKPTDKKGPGASQQGDKTPQKAAAEKPAEKATTEPVAARVLPGGVKYEVLKTGTGKIASVGKRVKVKYEGRLARNGKKFDSGSLDFTVGSGDMIKGFDLGVRGMLVQERRRILIPARLGYGKQSVGGILPNSDLIFEVTLLATS